ncbi:hypothetical protein B0H14DRAFT_3476054 [Mycena olivaceomarginata]|nr:hypothetical protein B0H14DRAFT_3476054 [Mycena olivaceomarginata]
MVAGVKTTSTLTVVTSVMKHSHLSRFFLHFHSLTILLTVHLSTFVHLISLGLHGLYTASGPLFVVFVVFVAQNPPQNPPPEELRGVCVQWSHCKHALRAAELILACFFLTGTFMKADEGLHFPESEPFVSKNIDPYNLDPFSEYPNMHSTPLGQSPDNGFNSDFASNAPDFFQGGFGFDPSSVPGWSYYREGTEGLTKEELEEMDTDPDADEDKDMEDQLDESPVPPALGRRPLELQPKHPHVRYAPPVEDAQIAGGYPCREATPPQSPPPMCLHATTNPSARAVGNKDTRVMHLCCEQSLRDAAVFGPPQPLSIPPPPPVLPSTPPRFQLRCGELRCQELASRAMSDEPGAEPVAQARANATPKSKACAPLAEPHTPLSAQFQPGQHGFPGLYQPLHLPPPPRRPAVNPSASSFPPPLPPPCFQPPLLLVPENPETSDRRRTADRRDNSKRHSDSRQGTNNTFERRDSLDLRDDLCGTNDTFECHDSPDLCDDLCNDLCEDNHPTNEDHDDTHEAPDRRDEPDLHDTSDTNADAAAKDVGGRPSKAQAASMVDFIQEVRLLAEQYSEDSDLAAERYLAAVVRAADKGSRSGNGWNTYQAFAQSCRHAATE